MLAERARIARELHDSVSQTLYAIILGAARARGLLEQNKATEVQRIIDDVVQLAKVGQGELRALLADIRSDQVTSRWLVATLENLASDARTRNRLDIRLSVADDQDMSAATTQAMAMIAREALNNVIRHAAAHRVDIVVERDRGQMKLLITDDGHGFDPAAPRPGHFGLQSMRERAGAVGGTVDVISAVALGTQVCVSIPS